MFSKLLVIAFCGVVFCAEEPKNSKRSLSSFGLYPWNSILEHPSAYPLINNVLSHGYLNSFSSIYPEKSSHFGPAASSAHDVAAAVAAAKEATAAAALAQQKVQAAREQVLIQERVAAAKAAAAHAAIQRSEAATQVAAAIQKSEALVAAAAAVQKSAAISAASAVAAHPANHFSSGPWSNAKSSFSHWG